MKESRYRWVLNAEKRAKGDEPKRRKPLPRVGKKALRDREEMAAVKPFLLHRSGGECEAMDANGQGFSPWCAGVGSEMHHVVPRSVGGSNELSNLLWICRACHKRIDDYPGEARRRGLHRYSWEAS